MDTRNQTIFVLREYVFKFEMWVIASLCPIIGSQLDHSPVQNGYKKPYLLEYGTNTVELILTQFKALTVSKLKTQATQQIKEHLSSFKTI